MRVLAVRFPDRTRAATALSTLRQRLGLSQRDAAIAPLATPGEPATGETLLAGHFRESDVPQVANVVEEIGGEIVADVDERWTVPRQPAEADAGRPDHRKSTPRPGDRRQPRRERDRERRPVAH